MESQDPDLIEIRPNRARHGGSILMAAMLGLADALGLAPEQKTEVTQPGAPDGGDSLDLDFGHLPPLD